MTTVGELVSVIEQVATQEVPIADNEPIKVSFADGTSTTTTVGEIIDVVNQIDPRSDEYRAFPTVQVNVTCPDGTVHTMSAERAASFVCPTPTLPTPTPVLQIEKSIALPRANTTAPIWPIFAGLGLIGAGSWFLARK